MNVSQGNPRQEIEVSLLVSSSREELVGKEWWVTMRTLPAKESVVIVENQRFVVVGLNHIFDHRFDNFHDEVRTVVHIKPEAEYIRELSAAARSVRRF